MARLHDATLQAFVLPESQTLIITRAEDGVLDGMEGIRLGPWAICNFVCVHAKTSTCINFALFLLSTLAYHLTAYSERHSGCSAAQCSTRGVMAVTDQDTFPESIAICCGS